MENRLIKESFQPPISYEIADSRADLIIKSMTLEEKILIVGGHNLFFTKGFEQYGIPPLYLADSTQGVHIRKEVRRHMEKSTAFPCPIALAATWNCSLSRKYGHSVGEQCRAGDIAVLLGPGMNIYRLSQCGRNFEYFGEDPYLAARMVENYVLGVQRTGTIATLKHFLCNNTDHRRRRSNSIVDERALHEIYLPAFKAGIDAGAMAVMTSYNQVNGEWTGQSRDVIAGLLRNRLGFKWLVMTDWWSIYDPLKAIQSGLDLDMPGHLSEMFGEVSVFGDVYVKTNARRLLDEGRISESDIERMAKGVLRTIIAAGLLDRPVKEETLTANFPKHEQVALQTARESMVLLRNEKNCLPLTSNSEQKILLTGWFIDNIARGKGAAEVEGYDEVTLLAGLSQRFGASVVYRQEPSEQDFTSSDAVIVSIGTIDSEGFDKPFDLPAEMNALVLKAAALNPRTIVIVYTGGGVNMSPWNERVGAIIYAWYPGQNGNLALAEILAGDLCPCGKLPITIEKTFTDSPGYGYKPADEPLDTDFSADLRLDIPVRDVHYHEGIFVGYRWYEYKQIAPLYPFGFGLSYASFGYSHLKLSVGILPGTLVRAECTITNTGKHRAKEIVQLYIHPENAPVPRPVKELKGFQKIKLDPGQSKILAFDLKEADFAFWDVKTSRWTTEQGAYRIMIGSSSEGIYLHHMFQIR